MGSQRDYKATDFIPDFIEWRNYNCYAQSFERLIRDLKTEEKIVSR